MKRQPIGFYNYTVILTYIGMLAGFLGITCAFGQKTLLAMICLMVAGLCDMFDGAIAGTMERNDDEKCFGIQIDSLSDLICFGVLPAVIIYSVNEMHQLAYAISALFTLAALIRLAYFNVDEQNRQRVTDEHREIYKGLPVTSIAGLLPLVYLIQNWIGLENYILCDILVVVVGVLFITPFQLKKPGVVGKGVMAIIGAMIFGFLIHSLGTF